VQDFFKHVSVPENILSVLRPTGRKKEYRSKCHYDESILLLQRRLATKISPPTLMTVNFKKPLMVGKKVLTATEATFRTPTSRIFFALFSFHSAFHRIQNS